MTRSLKLSSLSIALAALAGGAGAVEFKAGDTTVNVGGIVNAYYTMSRCTGTQLASGIPLANQSLGCGGFDKSTTIGNGLLPNYLAVGMKTTQNGYDIGATIGIGSAVSSSSQVGNNTLVDVRQGFGTFGTASMGTVKFGRDYGYYGKNAILSDMTLLGAGMTTQATQRNRVTLGHIGAGYTYLGTYGQMAYSTPDLSGFGVTVALMSPVDDGGPAGNQPQLQGLLEYKIDKLGKVWVAAKTQKFRASGLGPEYTMRGAEVGASASFGPVDLLGNFQSGKGIGILADGDSGNVKQTNYLLQGVFNVTGEFRAGLSYGQSKLKDQVGPAFESNTNLTGGVYYKLTPALTLVGELSQTRSESADGSLESKLKGVALGAILFF